MDLLYGNNKLVVPFSEKDLLCKNECGFYGNPQWQGFCSKCWRDYLKQINNSAASNLLQSQDESSSQQLQSPGASKSWNTFGFDKFLEKKNQHTKPRSSTLRSFLKKSPSYNDNARAASPTSTSQTKSKKSQQQQPLQRQLSMESQNAKENFFTFLRELPGAMAQDISKMVKQTVDRILQHTEVIPIDDLSELVHDLYQVLQDRLNSTNYSNSKDLPYTVEEIMNRVEDYICSRCYSVLFCPSTDEEVGDLSLQDRIRSLNWVTCGFLDSGLAFENTVVRDKLDGAVTEIIDMNSRRGPQQKLNGILQCSKLLFEALKESRNGQVACADEFLPALIFVILKSNPPLLQSNINFIARFALPSKVNAGETGYYFTNLCCAMNFVQNLNADSLKMPKEEFEAYTSGQLAPPLNDATCRCQQAVKSLENSLEELKLLQQKADHLSTDVIDVMAERHSREWERLIDDVTKFNESYPPTKSLDDWLDSSPEKEHMLPLPLIPTVVRGENEKLEE